MSSVAEPIRVKVDLGPNAEPVQDQLRAQGWHISRQRGTYWDNEIVESNRLHQEGRGADPEVEGRRLLEGISADVTEIA